MKDEFLAVLLYFFMHFNFTQSFCNGEKTDVLHVFILHQLQQTFDVKGTKNLHKGLFIQMKGRSKNKSLQFQPFSKCYMFLYLCGKKYFLFFIQSIMSNYISFCKKKTFAVTLSISFDHLCDSQCHHFAWLFLLRLFN